MIDDGNGNKLPIALTDPSPQPSKSFGVTYDHPATFTLTASPRTGTDVVCAPQAAPLTLQIEVLGPATGLLAPANGTKTNVPASTNPSEKPPCAQDEAAQARQLKAGIKVDICPPTKPTPPCVHTEAEVQRAKIAGVILTLCTPTKPTTPPCVKDEAAQARQLKAGNKVDICPPKSETPPTCFKSKAEQSEYSKKNNPKTVPLVCK
jgi:hypothetical protein